MIMLDVLELNMLNTERSALADCFLYYFMNKISINSFFAFGFFKNGAKLGDFFKLN